ncbi:MAG: OmpA family protein [Bacteroidetes bacterium]|nr:OmpA family protein [Bacteroidota bacterium]
MLKSKNFIIFSTVLILFCSFKPVDKLLRKAARQTEKGNIQSAKTYYLKAIQEEPDNYKANLGLGLLLSELLDNYNGALPYLEKAYQHSEKDTLGDLLYALGKSYHNVGEYEKAISFYDRLEGFIDYEGEIEFDKDVKKRKSDCLYGIAHRNAQNADKWYIVNAGKNINSDMPEYVPVLTPQNELIFTSRRKDDAKEQVSYLDGKYFESMYISKLDYSGFQPARRYTLPDQLKSKYLRSHESVVSMSADGAKLFTFRNNKIFEINMDQRQSQQPKKLLKTINFDYYQNHAFLTKDGNTLYFTSEADGGLGGIDIYKSTKVKDGEWTKPENIGEPINTPYDEDAPFVTEDGKTMYFASTGHEGYGNFDIYKSELVGGKWSPPVNMGAPVNSPAHDIFMVQDSKGSSGYFSSGRVGGYGDMDIYKIIYLDNFDKECPSGKPYNVTLNIIDGSTEDFANAIEVVVPKDYKILAYEWKVNGEVIESPRPSLSYDYKKPGTYTVTSKVVAYCDTCLTPIIACNTIENRFNKGKIDSTLASNNSTDSVMKNISTADVAALKGLLSDNDLKSVGFNMNPILFNFNKSDLREDAIVIVQKNSEILKKYPTLKVEIIGYTDSRGSQSYNEALSKRRANSVKKYLKEQGVKMSQVKFSIGKGIKEPAVDCKGKDCDENAHQQNRRVIFQVYGK